MSGIDHLASITEDLRDVGFLPMIMPRDNTDSSSGNLYTRREQFWGRKSAIKKLNDKNEEIDNIGSPAICIPDNHGTNYVLTLPTVDELLKTKVSEVNFYPEHYKATHLTTLEDLTRNPFYKNVAQHLKAYQESDIKITIQGFELTNPEKIDQHAREAVVKKPLHPTLDIFIQPKPDQIQIGIPTDKIRQLARKIEDKGKK